MNESIVWQEQLLATKFFAPAFSHNMVPRTRLTSLLDRGLRYKLTLLSAPAGFGKTTLVSDWAQLKSSANTPIAWVSLEEGDNDPVRFWTYVLTSLDATYHGIGQEALTSLRTPQGSPIQSILTTFINHVAASSEPCLLILDDYHVIAEQAIHDAISFLLEHQPPQLHITLLTRVDPPLSLGRLRVRGQILELRTDQLRCTSQEAADFLTSVMGLSLTAVTVQEMETRTEGWIAGLQLAALSMRGRSEASDVLAELRGSHRYILDYLTDEVLRQQRTALQTFLYCTSILERLSAPLCDALMQQSGSQEMLEELERANLFVVSLDAQRRWYRYHALFAEALRYRLEQAQRATIPLLHLRASQWYAAQGHTFDAVQHALQARAWQWAADLIETVALTLNARTGELTTVRRWVELLPVEVAHARPRLCLAYAQALFGSAPPETMESWIQAAESGIVTLLATSESTRAEPAPYTQAELNSLLAETFALRALNTGTHGEKRLAFSFGQQSLDQLSEQNRYSRALVAVTDYLAHIASGDVVPAIQSALEAAALAQPAKLSSLTIAAFAIAGYGIALQGHLHEAWQVLEQAVKLHLLESGGEELSANLAYAYQADILREWNRLDAAFALAQKAVRLGEQSGLLVSLDTEYVVLASVALARGELDAAATALERAEQIVDQLQNDFYRALHLTGERMRFWLIRGERERASQWVEEWQQQAPQASSLAREREMIACIRVLLAQRKPEESLVHLAPLLEKATQQERWGNVIEMLLLQALALQMNHREQEALAVLAQAVRLAEPEGYIRRFVDEGPLMATLLSKLREQERKQGPTPYLDSLLAAFMPGRQASQSAKTGEDVSTHPLPDPLSERELEVLRLLARGASNLEIAEELVVAVNTVKHHVSMILSKLQASNRTQAVARARSLGLLPDEP